MSTNGWSQSVERLLGNWSQQISINERSYVRKASFYRGWYYAFGAFIIIAQTGALTTLINAIATGTGGAILIVVAVLETLILIAQGLDKFFNFGSGAEKYYDAAKEHNALSRFIDSTLALARKDRDTARETLLSIQQQFRQLQDESPSLPPDNVIHKLEMCIYEDPQQACGNTIDVSHGTGILVPQAETTQTDTRITIQPPHVDEVDMPSPPVQNKQLVITFQEQDDDEEVVTHAAQHRIRNKIQRERVEATREQEDNKGIFKVLEYQWRRMEQHGEDLPEHIDV